MKNGFNASSYISINGMVGAITTIAANMTPIPPIETTSVLLACVGIEFYQKVGTEYYLLSSGNAMKVANVY